jgi:hypothetical protein
LKAGITGLAALGLMEAQIVGGRATYASRVALPRGEVMPMVPPQGRGMAIPASCGPPAFHIEPNCGAAGRGAMVAGRNQEACLVDENTAEDNA